MTIKHGDVPQTTEPPDDEKSWMDMVPVGREFGSPDSPQTTAADKIEDGLREALELIQRAQEIDPDAWDGSDGPASVRRRMEAIWRAKS